MRGKGRRWKELIRTKASKAVRRISRKIKRKRKRVVRRSKPVGELGVGRLIPFCKWLVYRREVAISANFIGRKVSIHNGHRWFTILITKPMVGSCFGEFAPPKQWRGSMIHRGNKTEIKKNKKISNLKSKKGGVKKAGGKKGAAVAGKKGTKKVGGKTGVKGGKVKKAPTIKGVKRGGNNPKTAPKK